MNKPIPIIIQKNDRSKYIYFSVMFLAGTIMETSQNVGISHLLEHMLLEAGGKNSLNCVFDLAGVKINGLTTREYICLKGYFLKEQVNIFFPLLIHNIYELKFDTKELDRNREIIKCEMSQYNHSRNALLVENSVVYQHSLWEEDVLGNTDSIFQISLENLEKFRKEIIHNGLCAFAFKGNIEIEDLKKISPISIAQINQPIDWSRNQTVYALPKFNSTAYENYEKGLYSDISIVFKLQQLRLAELVPSLAVFNTMLTMLDNSVLNKKLREQLNYVYHVISYPVIYNSIIVFKIKTKTDAKYSEKVIHEILFFMNQLCEDSQLWELFDAAKSRVYNEILFQEENEPLKTVEQLSKYVIFSYPTNTEILEQIETLTYCSMKKIIEYVFQNKNEKCVICETY